MPILKSIEERDPYAAAVLDAFDKLAESDHLKPEVTGYVMYDVREKCADIASANASPLTHSYASQRNRIKR